MPKQLDAFALKNFDARKIFDFAAWYKKAHDGLTPELWTQVADAVTRAEISHRRIVRHLMRLIRLKALMASQLPQADEVTLEKIKQQVSRADKLTAAYEDFNRQAFGLKQAAENILDDMALIERRRAKDIFSRKLSVLREERKLTRQEMARRLCLKQSTYSAYERGEIEPTISILGRLAKYFNKSADWFLGLK